ncbi:hypothetical protein Hanom_Chr03g00256971 [Helianthus anomalus]
MWVKSPSILVNLAVLQELKPKGLNEAICNESLKSLSKKRSCSGDSEETCSEGGKGSKGSSLEASETTGVIGRKKRKAKNSQDDGVSNKDDAAKSIISDAAIRRRNLYSFLSMSNNVMGCLLEHLFILKESSRSLGG